MANKDAPSGARPVMKDGSSYNGSAQKVQVDVGNATAIFVGDFVVQEADGNYTAATAGATNVIDGVCVGVVVDRTIPATEHPGYLPATTAGYIYIVPADSCYFAIQEDSDTSTLAATERGARVNFIAGAGSTTTGRSGHEIDSSSVGQDATYQLSLIDIVQAPDNAIGANAEWIVKVNLDQKGRATAGI